MEQVDWHEEWAKHAFGFYEGAAHIDFIKLGLKSESTWRKNSIKLAPGPGFGDCSHPTTRLVLKLMHKLVANKCVLDVGCGSGILSLAAMAFGAKKVVGIDIDPEALLHAANNARLNGYEEQCHFAHSTRAKPDVILMNMIRTEQKAAFENLPKSCHIAEMAVTSGILKEDRKTYLKQTAEWGWQSVFELQEEGWLGFQFTMSNRA